MSSVTARSKLGVAAVSSFESSSLNIYNQWLSFCTSCMGHARASYDTAFKTQPFLHNVHGP